MALSEDSYRTDLIQKLNTLLPKPYKAINSLNIKISKEDERYKVLKKLRREFDVIILDDTFIGKKKVNIERIEYAIETKRFGSSFAGIGQAEDAFTAFKNLKVTYATNFKDSLYRRERNGPENNFPISHRNVDKIYEQISEIITEDVRKLKDKKAEPGHQILNESQVIDMLKECMEKIQQEMIELPDESKLKMTERTLVMWKKSNEKESNVIELEYNIKRAASYIIVDQFLFYNLLQKNSSYKLRELKKEDEEEDDPDIFATKYFKRAIQVTKDYRPIFEIDMLSLLPKTRRVVKTLNEVIRSIQDLKFEQIQADILGKIFHSMVPAEIRKQIAAYYTSNAAAQLLAELSIGNPQIIVGDLACGSGTLLIESYKVKKRLYNSEFPKLTDGEIHKKIISKEIFGNDITLFATHLTMMNLCIQNLNEQIEKVNITSMDGLQIIPKKKVGGLMDFMGAVQVDALTIDGDLHSIIYPQFDLIIMNPPFSRQTDMDESLLENLKRLKEEWWPDSKLGSKYINNRMGLHGYFLLHANRVLKKNGTISMVLPASTFTTNYTKNILSFLEDNKYAIDYVIEILTKDSTFSEDCNFREFMIILRKNRLREKNITHLISFLDEIHVEEMPDIIVAIKSQKKHKKFVIKEIKTKELYKLKKWTNIFSHKVTNIHELFNSEKLSRIVNEKAIEIKSGKNKGKLKIQKELNPSQLQIYSGYHGTYSDFLMLPNKDWTIEKINEDTYRLTNKQKPLDDDTRQCEIDSKYVISAIRKSGDFNSFKAVPNSYTLNIPYRIPATLNKFRRIYLHWAEQKLKEIWSKAQKDGHKRVKIITRPTYKTPKGKSVKIIDEVPWYSHAFDNNCDKTISKLFLVKKYRGKTRKSLTLYTNDDATVNHGSLYYVKTKHYKFYASWFSSSVYLYSLLNENRTISLGYWEMMVGDFNNVFIPLFEKFSDSEKLTVINSWKKLFNLSDDQLPFLPQQFGSDFVKRNRKGEEIERNKFKPLKERIELDRAWLKILGIPEEDLENIINELYDWIKDYMEKR